MKLKDYVEKLRMLNLTKEELIGLRLINSMFEETLTHYTLNLKNLDTNIEATAIGIVENCDVDNFVVFTFRFSSEIKTILQYKVFGEVEADSVALDTETGEVVLILHTNIGDYELGYIDKMENITPVAKSQQGFLEALYVAAELSSKIIKGELTSSTDDLSAQKVFSDKCIQLAGGEKYEQFWPWYMGTLE